MRVYVWTYFQGFMFPHFTFIPIDQQSVPVYIQPVFSHSLPDFFTSWIAFRKFSQSIWNLHMTIACLGTLSLPSPFSFSVYNVFLTFGLVWAVLDFYLAPFKLFFLKFTLSFSVCVTLLSSGAIETSDHE